MTNHRGLEWQDNALCAQVDPALFFIEQGGNGLPGKRVCGRCPVQTDCLDYALTTTFLTINSNGQPFQKHLEGIWGGTTEDERRRMRTARRRTAA